MSAWPAGWKPLTHAVGRTKTGGVPMMRDHELPPRSPRTAGRRACAGPDPAAAGRLARRAAGRPGRRGRQGRGPALRRRAADHEPRTGRPPRCGGRRPEQRSLAVDLKDPRGVDLFGGSREQADVVVEGFRPGVAERLGVGYASVSARNPRLVYASLTGVRLRRADERGGRPRRRLPRVRRRAGDDRTARRAAVPPGRAGRRPRWGGAARRRPARRAVPRERVRSRRAVEVAMYDAALAWTSVHAAAVWATGESPGPGASIC